MDTPRLPACRLALAALLCALPVFLRAAPPNASPASLTARAWGNNEQGEVGDGADGNKREPVLAPKQVKGLTGGVTSIAAGRDHSLAVQNGAVEAWGTNGNGQLGNGEVSNNPNPVPVPGLTSGVTAVAAGDAFSLAIQNGAVLAWGFGGKGRLGNGAKADSPTPVQVTGLTEGVTAIAAGSDHALAIQNGAAKAWGWGGYGLLGNVVAWTFDTQSSTPVQVAGLTEGVTAVAAGIHHSLAIQHGAALAWGENTNGELGNGSNTRSATPVPVAGLTEGVTAIAAGGNYSLAVQNGNVFAWGFNDCDQLGKPIMSNDAPVNTPFQVFPDRLKNIVQVATGYASSYALGADGSLWVWGDDAFGQLGLNSNPLRYGRTRHIQMPERLLPPKGLFYRFIDADANGVHVVAILGDKPPGVH